MLLARARVAIQRHCRMYQLIRKQVPRLFPTHLRGAPTGENPREMATFCSTTASLPSCNLAFSIIPNSSKLSALRSLQCAPLHGVPLSSRRLSARPRRRILPRVEAKKHTFSSFDELLEKSDKPVLVDFYATWCGPCQFMVPILEQVSEQLKDRVQIVKIDTEKYTQVANRYQIEALPTFIIFRDGKPCDRFEGALPADQLIKRIENALKVPL